MRTGTISIERARDLLNYTIDNNIKLQKRGELPIAIGFEASAGIGKTSLIQQVAKERNMGYTKVSLHEMDEAGDLLGMPQIEYECQLARKITDTDGNVTWKILDSTAWLNSKQLDSMSKNKTFSFKQTGNTRMGYAKPAWVPEYNENGTLVCLDDYTRATPQLLQSAMELILTQKYTSWSLPDKTTVVLTNNPDDGAYNVGSLDEAQRGRFMNYNLDFELASWVQWAEKAHIDSRCITFVINYADELFNDDGEGNRICNPRSFVMFANMISGIKDWDLAENQSMINLIAKGCFKDDLNRFANMFSNFIKNKMHLIIQPKELLTEAWSTVQPKVLDTLYDSNGQWRPDLALLLERRLAYFINAWLSSSDKTPIKTVENRIINILDSDEKNGKMIFNKDQMYQLIKTITSENRRQTSSLLLNPRIAKVIS